MSGRPNGHARSDQIAAEIDRTRGAVDRTVDALMGKLTPQQLLVEAAGALKSGSSTLAQRVVQTAREHPVPATIIAAGIGMLLMERSKGAPSGDGARVAARRPETTFAGTAGYVEIDPLRGMGEAASVGEKASDVKDRVTQRMAEASDTVGDRVAEVADRVGETASRVQEKVGDTVTHAKDQARVQVKRAKLGFWQAMEEQPLAVGAVAVAIGLAAGLVLPRTHKEDELLGAKRDELVGNARRLGSEMLHKGTEVARVAAETVRNEAQKEGITPSALADKAREVGRHAAQAASAEADREGLTSSGTDTTNRG